MKYLVLLALFAVALAQLDLDDDNDFDDQFDVDDRFDRDDRFGEDRFEREAQFRGRFDEDRFARFPRERQSRMDRALDNLDETVTDWSNELYTAFKTQNLDDISDFFDRDSTIKALNREFEGDDIPMLFFMMDRAFRADSFDYKILAADDTKLASIVQVTLCGTFLKTNIRVELAQLHVLEFKLGVVDRLTVVNTNLNTTIMAAVPECERVAWQLIYAAWMNNDYITTSTPFVQQFIHPQFELTTHLFPNWLSRNRFEGIQGFVDMFNVVWRIWSQLDMRAIMNLIDITSVYSDNSTVVFLYEMKDQSMNMLEWITCSEGKILTDELWQASMPNPFNPLNQLMASAFLNATELLPSPAPSPVPSMPAGSQAQIPSGIPQPQRPL